MIRILHGDNREILPTLPDRSVHCVVTSPPYFGLRDYGTARWDGGDPSCDHSPDTERQFAAASTLVGGTRHQENAGSRRGYERDCRKCGALRVDSQIGLEATPEAFVAELVQVFREVRRVLRDDGTLWLNLGDSYCSTDKWGGGGNVGKNTVAPDGSVPSWQVREKRSAMPGLKPKDLIGIPWRVAFALQQPYYTGQIKDERDRTWLAAIIDGEGCFFVHKRKAGGPAHARYTRADGSEATYSRTNDTFGVGLEICNTSRAIIDRVTAIVGGGTVSTQSPQQNARRKQTIYRWRVAPNEAKRIAQEVYPHLVAKQHQARILFACPSTGEAGAAAHQAMMDLHNGVETAIDYPAPPSMFEPGWYLRQDCIWAKPNPMPESVTDRCTKSHEYLFILSKSPTYFCDMAAIAEAAAYPEGPGNFATGKHAHQNEGVYVEGAQTNLAKIGARDTRNKRSVWTVATQPFKEAHFATFPPDLIEPCIKAGCPVGGTVLDPFGGAGTTGLVADRLQRDAILIELNPAYADMARRRVADDAPLFAEVN